MQTEPSFATKEIMVGESRNCGSAFINTRCREAIRNWPHFRNYSDDAREILADYGAESFEAFKKHSLKEDLEDPIDFEIEYPITMVRRIIPSDGKGWDNFWPPKFYHDQITRDFMEPSLQETVQLVEKAINRASHMSVAIKRIFLTGGFSASTYLYNRLQKCILETHDVELCKPNIPEAAVAQGIVTIALSQSAVRSSASRLSIGLDELQEYDPEKHSPQALDPTDWNEGEKGEYAQSIGWIIRRGESMEDGKVWPLERRRTISLQDYFAGSPERKWWIFNEQVLGTESEAKDGIYPYRSRKSNAKGRPANNMHTLLPGFFEFQTFTVDLSRFPKSKRDSLVNPKRKGQDYLELHYKYEVTQQDRELTFRFISSVDPTVSFLLDPLDLEEDITHHSINYDLPEPKAPRADISKGYPSPRKPCPNTETSPESTARLFLSDRERSKTMSVGPYSADMNEDTEVKGQVPLRSRDVYSPSLSPSPEPWKQRLPATRLRSKRNIKNGGPGPATMANRARQTPNSPAQRSETLSREHGRLEDNNVESAETLPHPIGRRSRGFELNSPNSSSRSTPAKDTGSNSRQRPLPLRTPTKAQRSENRRPQGSSTAMPATIAMPRTPRGQRKIPITSGQPVSCQTSTRRANADRLRRPPTQSQTHLTEASWTESEASFASLPAHGRSSSLSRNTALNLEIEDLALPRPDMAASPGQKRKRAPQETYSYPEIPREETGGSRKRQNVTGQDDDAYDPS